MRLANRLVREFPAHPDPYNMLAEAFLQRSKNAWKRRDVGEIRRELARAVEAGERAVALGPDDPRFREHLRDLRERLAALPAS